MRRPLPRALATALAFALAAAPGAAGAQQQLLNYPTIEKEVVADRHMVVSQSAIASEVGSRILAQGGNAVDAAVATALALAVVLPRAGNIGGDGFMLVHLAKEKRTVAIDYRSASPAAATLAMFVKADGTVGEAATLGIRSAGVPGTIAGLALAHRRYGRLAWHKLVAPAIELAEKGVILSRDEVYALEWGRQRMRHDREAMRTFFKPDGSSYRAGERLRQPDLAGSLRQIARDGPDTFYRGRLARRIVAGMAAAGGLITLEDLARYRAVERPALLGSYRGAAIATMPPSSGGGASLLEALNILERFDMVQAGQGSARSLHLVAEAMKLSNADRFRYAGDGDFEAVPLTGLTSKAYAARRASAIHLERAAPSDPAMVGDPWQIESRNTTHFSVVDADGNAVSNTFTLGSDFGSGTMIAGTGFLLGNLMGNFALGDQARTVADGRVRSANRLAPGRRPVSSMTPTMLFRDGRLWVVTGSPGGSTIVGTLAQLIVDLVDFELSIAEATHRPRLYQDFRSGVLKVERGFSPDTLSLLRDWGHKVEVGETIGSAQSILLDGGRLQASADPRRPGAAAVGH